MTTNSRGSGTKTNDTEGNNSQEDQNKRGAVVTGFHDDTTHAEEIITSMGMPIDQIKIKCPAKPITRAFLQVKDNDDRDKFVRSANILKKELRGRKMKISWTMDVEERSRQKRLGSINQMLH